VEVGMMADYRVLVWVNGPSHGTGTAPDVARSPRFELAKDQTRGLVAWMGAGPVAAPQALISTETGTHRSPCGLRCLWGPLTMSPIL